MFDNLPKEIIYKIIFFINDKTLVRLYKTGLLPLTEEDICKELSIRLNMNIKDYMLDYILDWIEIIIVPEYYPNVKYAI